MAKHGNPLFFLTAGFFLAFAQGAEDVFSPPSVRANGWFARTQRVLTPVRNGFRVEQSENGRYRCEFSFAVDGILQNLDFYADGRLVFGLPNTGAHSARVSNAGILLLTRIDWATETPSRLSFYSSAGRKLMERVVRNPEFSNFSEGGDYFGVCTREALEVIHPASGAVKRYRTGRQFDISDDGSVVAVAYENGVTVYSGDGPGREITTGFVYNRGLRIAPDKSRLAVVDVRDLRVYALSDLRSRFSEVLPEGESFRQIRWGRDSLWAGVKYEDAALRRGILKTYSFRGATPSSFRTQHTAQAVGRSGLDWPKFQRSLRKASAAQPYPGIPWPFAPQNQAHMVWNNYEGFNSSDNGVVTGDYPYLHQGIDMEVNAYDRVYSVDTGIVKYHGDLGGSGAMYWRIAVSRVQTSGFSNGWLYAHLVDTSVNYTVGDRVPAVGLHLGDIVPWYGNISGHLHFNEIRDQGLVWSYTDGEWGITYNPLHSLTPLPDTSRPVIVQAIAGKSRFAYCPNNTGYTATNATYFYPDSARGGVRGNIDIIVRLQDFIVFTNYTQPAHSLRYWIKGISPGTQNYNRLIVDTTLAQVRNHAYNFYAVANFKPASAVLYKADNVFVVGGWFNRTRTFAHVLTNNNGDTLLFPGEIDSSLRTARYHDGWYRVSTRAYDISGNSVADSENVYFNNGIPPVSIAGSEVRLDGDFSFAAGKPSMEIRYDIPRISEITLTIEDPTGRRVKTLASGRHEAMRHTVHWNGFGDGGERVGAGIYFLRLQGQGYSLARKIAYSR